MMKSRFGPASSLALGKLLSPSCVHPFGMAAPLSTARSRLLDPTILFQSNHVLAVNKPPGWQSVSVAQNDEKCLLNFLQYIKRSGGGSDNSFLLPMHRLDQPCSGLLLYGKTRKAASRIQSKWKHIQKTYLVVVPEICLDSLRRQSLAVAAENEDDSSWLELRGLIPRKRRQHSQDWGTGNRDRGWSVSMIPWKEDIHEENQLSDYRLCSLQWRFLSSSSVPQHGRRSSSKESCALLEVRTNQGARHMVRAAFACHGSPLVGDLRYGAIQPLPDQSVALHARWLHLPPDHISLNLPQRDFSAPIPSLWENYFGFRETQVLELESGRVIQNNL
jgi:23S rRNA-/tRNA-specific pseudouridylate synthase